MTKTWDQYLQSEVMQNTRFDNDYDSLANTDETELKKMGINIDSYDDEILASLPLG